MKTSVVLQSFNWALDEICGNSNHWFLASASSVEKKIGSIKTIYIKVYLVNSQESKTKLILEKEYTGNIIEENKEKAFDNLSLSVIKDLILIFKDNAQQLIEGTYGDK